MSLLEVRHCGYHAFQHCALVSRWPFGKASAASIQSHEIRYFYLAIRLKDESFRVLDAEKHIPLFHQYRSQYEHLHAGARASKGGSEEPITLEDLRDAHQKELKYLNQKPVLSGCFLNKLWPYPNLRSIFYMPKCIISMYSVSYRTGKVFAQCYLVLHGISGGGRSGRSSLSYSTIAVCPCSACATNCAPFRVQRAIEERLVAPGTHAARLSPRTGHSMLLAAQSRERRATSSSPACSR